MANTIMVKAAGDNRKVVLYEQDAAHPGGQALISNNGETHEVAETAAVKRLMADGTLVKGDSKTATKPADASTKPDDKK